MAAWIHMQKLGFPVVGYGQGALSMLHLLWAVLEILLPSSVFQSLTSVELNQTD